MKGNGGTLMYIIMCLDTQNGLMFNKRRQSRDREIIKDMLELSDGRLFAGMYSARLFSESAKVTLSNDAFPFGAGDDDYCFAECAVPNEIAKNAQGFVLYKWNKLYPCDLTFDLDLGANGFICEKVTEFSGYSHDVITKEIWRKRS